MAKEKKGGPGYAGFNGETGFNNRKNFSVNKLNVCEIEKKLQEEYDVDLFCKTLSILPEMFFYSNEIVPLRFKQKDYWKLSLFKYEKVLISDQLSNLEQEIVSITKIQEKQKILFEKYKEISSRFGNFSEAQKIFIQFARNYFKK